MQITSDSYDPPGHLLVDAYTTPLGSESGFLTSVRNATASIIHDKGMVFTAIGKARASLYKRLIDSFINRRWVAFFQIFVEFSNFSHPFTRSYTINIFFLSNFFSQLRHLKNNNCQMIGADRLRSGDPHQDVLAVFDHGKLIFQGAGG